MMHWRVVKIGAEMFDALHAYGLGILIANATRAPVTLSDEGVVYGLSSQAQTLPKTTVSLLDEVLQPPSPEDVQDQEWQRPSVQAGNLDGLLAALFTTPGIRALSVADLLAKQRLRPDAIGDGLKKVNRAIVRWQRYAQRQTPDPDPSAWLDEISHDYDATNPQTPLPAVKGDRDLSVLMTLDPALSYSTCRPISDGLVTHRANIALRGTRQATLLALIGAARFLRARRVAGKLVNLYVPVPQYVILEAESTFPLLRPVRHAWDQATALQWLRYRRLARSTGADWQSLAYQVMQTQGAQQSISIGRGRVGYAGLAAVEHAVGHGLCSHWERLLRKPQEKRPFEVDTLVDCLLKHQAAPWLAHLREVSLCLHNGSRNTARAYRLAEIVEVTAVMNATIAIPLSAVLEREQGTLRFGRALRLLGNHSPGPLCDVIDTLDAVHTCDQLVRVMARSAQECAVASAKSQFIIVPDDEDLRCLLDDVDRYGARTVAGLLIILSALRYPRRTDEEPTGECDTEIQGGLGTRGEDDGD